MTDELFEAIVASTEHEHLHLTAVFGNDTEIVYGASYGFLAALAARRENRVRSIRNIENMTQSFEYLTHPLYIIEGEGVDDDFFEPIICNPTNEQIRLIEAGNYAYFVTFENDLYKAEAVTNGANTTTVLRDTGFIVNRQLPYERAFDFESSRISQLSAEVDDLVTRVNELALGTTASTAASAACYDQESLTGVIRDALRGVSVTGFPLGTNDPTSNAAVDTTDWNRLTIADTTTDYWTVHPARTLSYWPTRDSDAITDYWTRSPAETTISDWAASEVSVSKPKAKRRSVQKEEDFSDTGDFDSFLGEFSVKEVNENE